MRREDIPDYLILFLVVVPGLIALIAMPADAQRMTLSRAEATETSTQEDCQLLRLSLDRVFPLAEHRAARIAQAVSPIYPDASPPEEHHRRIASPMPDMPEADREAFIAAIYKPSPDIYRLTCSLGPGRRWLPRATVLNDREIYRDMGAAGRAPLHIILSRPIYTAARDRALVWTAKTWDGQAQGHVCWFTRSHGDWMLKDCFHDYDFAPVE